MNQIDIPGIALIIAVGFLVYYSSRVMRLLKVGDGWKYMTIGYFLYVPRVFLFSLYCGSCGWISGASDWHFS